jgi:hypothetical protein
MPFADNKALTEYVFNIPSIYKIHSGFSKFLLRGAMKDIVPDEIRLNKQKLGFYTPDICWISEIANDIKHRIKGLPDPENIINKDLLEKIGILYLGQKIKSLTRFIFRVQFLVGLYLGNNLLFFYGLKNETGIFYINTTIKALSLLIKREKPWFCW